MRRLQPKNEKNATSNIAMNDEQNNQIGIVEPIVRCYATQNITTECSDFNEEASYFLVTFPIIHTAVTVQNI